MDENETAQMKGSREAVEASGTRRLVWSVEEAGGLLGISRAHAYELVARGDLPHLRLGRRIVVPKRALDELLGAV
jgi:excisionase family DNA binding protein